ncbi:MAG TPA: efflux RND transporter periplasmic adaptor subunit [Terriglobales bacterium]|nr:efflux RND transporter periplasmic adaptor subunit [Terriglobales bacterium]
MNTGTLKHVLAGVALLTLTTLSACKSEKKAEANVSEQMRAVAVRTTTVAQRNIAEELSLTGTLKPQAEVQLVSEVSARLLRLLKNEGEPVRKGEVIAILDSTDARLAHERASAAVAVARANREHAVAERDRANNLLKTGGITDKDHLAANVNLQVAEASLRQAKAEEAIAAQQLARCQIHAPFSGRIAKRLVDTGTMLAVGTPVLMLVDNSTLEFRAAVTSADFSKVKIGAPAEVTVDAMPDFAAHGTVTRILPTVDERSRSFEIVVRVAGKENLISGLFARARVKVRDINNAVVVPPAALMHDGSRADVANVFVVENGKAEVREIAVGVEALDSVEVREGLKPGMIVVVDPPTTLASGAPVHITDSNRVDR